MDINHHPGDAIRGPEDRFSGDVWLWPRIGATANAEVRNVLFTPGSRSAWHRHPATPARSTGMVPPQARS